MDYQNNLSEDQSRSRQAFVELAMDVCGVLEPVEWITPAGDEGRLAIELAVQGQTTRHTLDLEKVWLRVHQRSVPEQRDALVRAVADVLAQPSPGTQWRTARRILFSAVRPFESLQRMSIGRKAGRLIWRPFAGDLVRLLALRVGNGVRYVDDELLARWRATPERAWAGADHNLVWLVPTVGRRRRGALYRLESGRVDAVSYLACPGWLAAFGRGAGSVIAWCGDRDRLMVFTVDSTVKGVADFQLLARWAFEQARLPVSSTLLTVDHAGAVVSLESIRQAREPGEADPSLTATVPDSIDPTRPLGRALG